LKTGQISVIAGGGLLWRYKDNKTEIALIKRKGVWDLPKGKQEPGESIISCARREVAEELGIPAPEVTGHIGQSWHSYTENGVCFFKTTYWYTMKPTQPNPDFKPQKNEQIEAVKWVEVHNALKLVEYENLKLVLQTFITRL